MTVESFRAGYVGIIGRVNVGKSTLLNTLLKQKISIVSPKLATTRYNLLGIKTTAQAQAVYIDTPGLQKSLQHDNSHQYISKQITSMMQYANIILFVVDIPCWKKLDEQLLNVLQQYQNTKLLVLLNKIDRIKDKKLLLQYITQHIPNNIETLPISGLKNQGIEKLEKLIEHYLPINQPIYPADQRTNQNDMFIATEFIREQLFTYLNKELPYQLTVNIEAFEQHDDGKCYDIYSAIWVKKLSHKKIIIGRNGSTLKHIRELTRKNLERFYKRSVYLKIWVKVKDNLKQPLIAPEVLL